jgi:hypothetical protein
MAIEMPEEFKPVFALIERAQEMSINSELPEEIVEAIDYALWLLAEDETLGAAHAEGQK